jgi:formylglycine-generating enzyme required for sulfatase activity/serine/threonine protein kinase
MSSTDPLALVGTTVAQKYAVQEVVGEGGYAVVYRATHLIWKRPVAIKVFKGLAGFTAEDRERLLEGFIQEGSLLADLSERSAAICQARDVGTLTTPRGDVVPYMVLEWLEGSTLEAVLRDEIGRRLPLRGLVDTVALLEPVAEALALAHRKGIAHRDMKPGNIFILGDSRSSSYTVKLLDFGIAKVVQDAQKLAGSFAQTGGEITSFTPSYGAPEQFSRSHGPTGPWTDVFALALILVEVLTGKEPLPGDNLVQMGYASSDPHVRPTPRTVGAEVSDDVERCFKRALAVSPTDRFPTAGEFWNELRSACLLEPMRGINTSTALRTVPASAPGPLPSQRDIALPQSTAGVTGTQLAGAPGGPEAKKSSAALYAIGLAVPLLAIVVGGGLMYKKAQTLPPVVNVLTPPTSVAVPEPPTCAKGMIRIPAGSFFMGSDDRDDLEFERPAHKVSVAAFCIDEFEVTTEIYKTASDDGEAKRAGATNDWADISAAERKAFDPLCNIRAPEDRPRHPINCVTWEMATGFCKAKKKRLPTEAEWEYAARGPDGRKYPWGDELPSANFLNACGKECVAWGKKNHQEESAMYPDDDGWPTTAPVGSFPAGKSRYGVQDVVGNVWEWVSDWYAPYTADEQKDPTGPENGEARVIRGGSWNGAQPSWVRPTFRYRDTPTKRSYGIGFRCAQAL